MKKWCGFLFILLVGFGAAFAAETGSPMTIAVTPFNNLSGKTNYNYLGFQIGEYLNTAFGGMKNIVVVERLRLQEIMKEQKLYLSGVTSEEGAVKLGQLANAKQMVIGSFNVFGDKISMTARIIDIEKGTVVRAAEVDGLFFGDIRPIVKALLYKLLDPKQSKDLPKDLKIDIPVEAKMAALEEQGRESFEDFGKALEASFVNNDKKALEYLKKTITSTEINYLNYDSAGNQFIAKTIKIEGDSLYTKMLQKQIATNAAILKDADEVSYYRNVLKLLLEKIVNSLTADSFMMTIGQPETITEGTVSVKIVLPSKIKIQIKPEAWDKVAGFIAEQDFVNTIENVPGFSRLPKVSRLMPQKDIDKLYDFRAEIRAMYAIQFVDKKNNVLYQLTPQRPVALYSFSRSGYIYEAGDKDVIYAESARSADFAYRDGVVEIQARATKNLAKIQVVLIPESIERRVEFPVYGNSVWKSVLLHCYRQKYIKIANDGDECPQVKDVQITDYFFTIPGYAIPKIPLLSTNNVYSGGVNLNAVAYWGDSGDMAVTAEWSFEGGIGLKSDPVQGSFNSESVLYFPINNTASGFMNGKAKCLIRAGDNRKEIGFQVSSAGCWRSPAFGSDVAFLGDRAIATWAVSDMRGGTVAIDMKTGRTLWTNSQIGNTVSVVEGRLVIASYYYNGSYFGSTSVIEPATGKILANNRILGGTSSGYGKTVLIAWGDGGYLKGGTVALDSVSGSCLWTNASLGQASYLGANRAVVTWDYSQKRGGTTAMDAVTGKTLWTNIVRGKSIAAEGNYVLISGQYGGYTGSTAVLDMVSGKTIWTNKAFGNTVTIAGNLALVSWQYDGKKGETACFELATGRTIWKAPIYGDDIAISGNQAIIVWNNVGNTGGTAGVDLATGDVLWTSSQIGNTIAVRDGIALIGWQSKSITVQGGTACIDLNRIRDRMK